MQFVPHQYQEYMIRRVVEDPQVGLFVGMGMGKTVATLTAIDELIYNRFEVDKVLVVAPLRVARDTWFDEAAKWDHLRRLRMVKVLGSSEERLRALHKDADVYVINRENVAWLVKSLRKWPFDMVVVDELSSFKSSGSQRFRALKHMRPQMHRVVGLTGTPRPNGIADLWPQIYLLDEGQRLGRTVSEFRRNYLYPDKTNGPVVYSYKPRENAEAEVHRKIGDIVVSLKSEDWLEMPERVDNYIRITMPPEVRAQYDRLERELILQLGNAPIMAQTAAVLSNKLLQLANGAAYNDDRGVDELHGLKLDVLGEILDDAQGQPVLVFYNYQHDLTRILKRFRFGCRLNSSGDIRDWNAGRIPLLLAHPASAGHGLNLQQGGHRIVWFGLPWSLELYQQANARLHRQGQRDTVLIHHIVAQGTMDEDVVKALERKNEGQTALLDAVKARVERAKSAAKEERK